MKTTSLDSKFAREERRYAFDWSVHPGLTGDQLDGDAEFSAEQDVEVDDISTDGTVTTFWVREGGLKGFNLYLVASTGTANGQLLQYRLSIPILLGGSDADIDPPDPDLGGAFDFSNPANSALLGAI